MDRRAADGSECDPAAAFRLSRIRPVNPLATKRLLSPPIPSAYMVRLENKAIEVVADITEFPQVTC